MGQDRYNVSDLPAPFDVSCDMKCFMLPMRDGVKLFTTVYFPPEMPERAGALFFRSPYTRATWLELPSALALRHGAVYILQACRGTGLSSGGVFHPSDADVELKDAEDTFAWLEQQPWFNGRCVMMGASYCGWVQWCALRAKGNPLVGISPRVAPLYSCCGAARKGGGASQSFAQNWCLSMYHRRTYGYTGVPNYFADLKLQYALPVIESDHQAGYSCEIATMRDFMNTAAEPGKFFRSYRDGFESVTAPAFIAGGWFDGFKQETIESFQLMKHHSATVQAQNFTRLTIGPWGHPGLLNPELFGAENDYTELFLREEKFLSGLLAAPEKDPLPGEETVKYFMLGENIWYTAGDWPPPGTETKKLYLHSNGNANTACGDGTLDNCAPQTEPADCYISDPAHPVELMRNGQTEAGCYDRSYVENRADMLIYTGAKQSVPLKITGNVRLEFYASATTVDTDFFATITDVTPEGKSMLLITGMVRARFADSLEQENFLVPGEVRRFEIDLGDIAVNIQPGHALRLELCGQEFPAFERNAQTGNAPFSDRELRTSRICILHDAEHPAVLTLPVMP